MTDDLPTPPLPEATSTTLVVGASEVSSGRCETFQRALPMAEVFSSWVISVQSSVTFATPGNDPTRARTSRWICARRGQPEVVRAIVTTTSPLSATVALRTMPRSTMSLPSSGSITPRRTATTSSGVGRGAVGHSPDSTGGTRVNSTADGRARRVTALPASSCSRRSATTRATPSTSSSPARRPRWPRHRSPSTSTSTPTRCARTSSACATSACSRWSPTPEGRSVGRSTATRSPPTRRRSASSRPRIPVLARMLLRLASAAGLPAGRRHRRRSGAGPGGRRPVRPAPLPCEEALSAELAILGFDPESVADDAGHHHRLHPLPVPGAGRGQPGARVRPAPRPGRGLRGRQGRRRGHRRSTTWPTASPCQVEIAALVPVAFRTSGATRTLPGGPVP